MAAGHRSTMVTKLLNVDQVDDREVRAGIIQTYNIMKAVSFMGTIYLGGTGKSLH